MKSVLLGCLCICIVSDSFCMLRKGGYVLMYSYSSSHFSDSVKSAKVVFSTSRGGIPEGNVERDYPTVCEGTYETGSDGKDHYVARFFADTQECGRVQVGEYRLERYWQNKEKLKKDPYHVIAKFVGSGAPIEKKCTARIEGYTLVPDIKKPEICHPLYNFVITTEEFGDVIIDKKLDEKTDYTPGNLLLRQNKECRI